ncbi:transcriptional regulator, MarR family [Aquipluma nitroreducens]|uniref:Transcriptional regulator, MarR family n=1 Tax=Aquipluma nitroreducens TaxID=2010828 RepID=A0A5K7SEZ4_9BACT|nr:winged helix DNA-binding protein [Aquipluma nitroreducens]BBE20161.1 transcriptional regulator, MarR family [Aquipluma nitroreducens]
MENKYDVLKQLIDLFENFEMENGQLDVLNFAQWILNKHHEEPELQEKISNKTILTRYQESSVPFKNHFDDKIRFLEAVAGIARYHEFYTRKALKDMVINTRLEFLFLQAVDMLERAKKTDLINIYHLEYTTGMDTIRRLINNGLLFEIQDENDKRIKLLIMSDLGKAVYEQAKKRINDESTMFFTAISDNKWKKVLPVLEEIDDFHSDVFQKHNNKPFAEISNLMDSLKHLFK